MHTINVIEIVSGNGSHIRSILLEPHERINTISHCGHVLKVFIENQSVPKAKPKPRAKPKEPKIDKPAGESS